MEFLNKLYESNYFGIGLFAVISFLVLMFLIVLFFGKKDEKKRKLEETNRVPVNNDNASNQAFKEVTEPTMVEVKPEENVISKEPDIIPTANDYREQVVENVLPIIPENNGANVEENIAPIEVPIKPLEDSINVPIINEPINLEETKTTEEPIVLNNDIPKPFEIPVLNNNWLHEDIETKSDTVTPIEVTKIDDIINDNNEVINTPEINFMPNMDISQPSKVEEPVKYDFETLNEPIIMEPTKIGIEPQSNEEIVKPIIEEKDDTLNVLPTIVEEPVIGDTYYQPVEEVKTEVDIPNIDFDALAKSISAELDELEKKTEEKHDEPFNNNLNNDFNSIYVASPSISPVSKIDLPTKKNE